MQNMLTFTEPGESMSYKGRDSGFLGKLAANPSNEETGLSLFVCESIGGISTISAKVCLHVELNAHI